MIKSQVRRLHSIRGKCMGSGARLHLLLVNRHWDIYSTHYMPSTVRNAVQILIHYVSQQPYQVGPSIVIHLLCGETEAQRRCVIYSRSHSLSLTQPGRTSRKAGCQVHVLKPPTTLLLVELSLLPLLLISCLTLGKLLISHPSADSLCKMRILLIAVSIS